MRRKTYNNTFMYSVMLCAITVINLWSHVGAGMKTVSAEENMCEEMNEATCDSEFVVISVDCGRLVEFINAVDTEIGDTYCNVVAAYAGEVMSDCGYKYCNVYYACKDPDYGGYSIHMLFDNCRYQCIWVNPDSFRCTVLYDLKDSSPTFNMIFN